MPYCIKPWSEIHFYNTGEVGVCCTSPVGSLYLGSINENPRSVWFGKRARKLRKLVLADRKVQAGCAGCVDLSLGLTQDLPSIEGYTSVKAQRNFRFLDLRDSEPMNLPTHIYFQMPYLCNLRCGYCIQEWSRQNRQKVYDPFPIDRFLEVYEEFFDTALSWLFVGGEVFADPVFHWYLDLMNPKRNPNCKLTIVTNGTLLDKALPTLKKFPNLLLNISVDATTEETYRKIRGANLSKLLENVDAFINYGKEKGLDWSVNFSNIVMRSNIQELPNMPSFALEHGASTSFGLIYGDLPNENIFYYPSLVNTILWENNINKTNDILSNIHAPWAMRAQQVLKGFYTYLNQTPEYNCNVQKNWLKQVYAMNGCTYNKPTRAKQMLTRGWSLARQRRFTELANKMRSKL